MTINDVIAGSIARVRAKYSTKKRYFDTQQPLHCYRCKAEIYVRMHEIVLEDGWTKNKQVAYDFLSNRRHLCYGINPVFDQKRQEIMIGDIATT
jgi:hypothetical protein